MSGTNDKAWSGFDEVFSAIATPDAVRENLSEDEHAEELENAGSLAEEISPEELEARMAGNGNQEEEEDETSLEENDEEDEEDNNNPNDDIEDDDEEEEGQEEIETPSTQEDSIEDEEISDAEIVGSFFDLFSNELGWEVEDEDKPKDIKDLVDLMSGIIESNSKPVYASEEMAELDEYVKNGGSLSTFFEKTSAKLDLTTIDMEKESNQRAVVKEYLKATTKLSDDKITKRVNRYDESGTLEEEAEEALELLKEHKSDMEQKLLNDQKNLKKAQLKEQQKFVTDVTSEIEGLDSINGVKLSSKDKKDLVNYLFKAGSNGKTSYQEDYSKSIKNLIVSAYFVKEGDKVFSKIKKQADTNAIKDLKKKIKKSKTKTKNQQPYNSGSSNVFDAIDAMSKVLSNN